MIFYHGTNEYGLQETLEQGFLLHKQGNKVYLATDKIEAAHYGDYILRVNYDPFIHPNKNNYCKNCWQLRVYEPIYDWKLVPITIDGFTIHARIKYKNHIGFMYDFKGNIFIICGHGCKKEFHSFQAWHKHVTKNHLASIK